MRFFLSLLIFTVLFSFTSGFAQGANPWVQEGKQVFLAQTQLEAYLSALDLKSVSEKMGLDDLLVSHYGDGYLTTFLKSLRLVTFNTFNVGRLIFTDEEKVLLKEWAFQRRSLERATSALKVIYDVMDKKGLRLKQSYDVIDAEPQYLEVRPWVDAISNSPWSKNILLGIAPQRPLLPSDFGLLFQTNFLDTDWKTLLSEQLNIANVYIFWRGPALIAALGETKLGMAISHSLRLNKLIGATKKLPKFLRGPALWLIYETADGCTIRYFYTAYVGLHQVSHPGIIRATGKIPTLPETIVRSPAL